MRSMLARIVCVSLVGLASCGQLSGLEDFEFEPPECVGEGAPVLCAGRACGSVVDRCGATVACPDTCGFALQCGASGVDANTCGCPAVPPPPPGCEIHDIVLSTGLATRYYLCEELLTWDEAAFRCTGFGTTLAVLPPTMPGWLEERDWVRGFLGGRKVHVGLSDLGDEGSFMWVSGLPMLDREIGLYFSPGEPNDADNAEDCVEMDGDTGLFNDIPCAEDANRARFLCEAGCSPPT